jgi:ligand-binding sensor domain-containing protein/sensor histidine kinase YesM
MKTRVLVIFFSLCFSVTVAGQIGFGTFTNYGIKDGLSQSTVTSIYQDHNGFIWLGTSDGLNKFDGQKFTIYKNNYKNPNSISDNWVMSILTEDSENNLWILTADWIINKFNLKSQEFSRFPCTDFQKDINNLRSIYSIDEDKNKNLWITSNIGLFKYDARLRNFKCYNPFSKADSASSKEKPIVSFIDSKGTLWFSSFEGLFRYDPAADKFMLYKADKKKPASLLSDQIIRMVKTPDKQTWIITKKGLSLYNFKNDNFISFPIPEKTLPVDSKFRIQTIIADKKGNIWIGLNTGLLKFNSITKTYSLYRKKSDAPGSISDNEILKIFEDKSGTIWVGTSNGLNKYVSETNDFRACYATNNIGVNNYIWDIIELKNNEIFVISRASKPEGIDISRLNKTTWKLELPPQNYCEPDNLSSSVITNLHVDNDGNLWLGTFGTGVFKYTPRSNKFSHYVVDPDNPGSFKNSIWSFAEDGSGNIWFSMYNSGIGKFDTTTKQITTINLASNSQIKHFNTASMAPGKNGEIWIATTGAGLIRFDPKTNKIRNYLNNPDDLNSLSSNMLRSIVIDRSGKLWLATGNTGIDRFDPQSGVFTHFNNNPNNKHYISNNIAWAIAEDKEGKMWFAVNGSVDCYNPQKEDFIYYPSKRNSSMGLITDIALCIYPDPAGNVWFGTSGGGLSKFDHATRTFTHFTENEGLTNNVVYGITHDNSGNLWLSTNRGLSRFNIQKQIFTNYRENAGLQSDEFNQGAYFKSSAGLMYFGGIFGFNVFSPDKFIADTLVPKTLITGLFLADKQIGVKLLPPHIKNESKDSVCLLISDSTGYFLTADISFTKKIILPYQIKVFSLQFAALTYNNPEKFPFRYKMENFDDDWHYTNGTNSATYTNLSPGTYVFKVATANGEGYWNSESTEIIVVIVPPFWKTWWFITLEALLLISFIWGYIIIREKNLKRSKENLEVKVRERTQQIEEKNEELRLRNSEILRQKEEIAQQARQLKTELGTQNKVSEMALLKAQINPHFLFNTLNNIYSLIYQKSEEAPSAIMKLSELMRYMVYEANADKVPLEKEINYLKSFIELQLLRLKNKDFVEFNIEGNIYGKTIAPMLLIPFVENAFKHGDKKIENPGIIINLVIEDEKMRFDVLNFYQQNGTINKDGTGGIGVINVKRRLELIHPDSHSLDVSKTGNQYNVHLELMLQ